MQIFKYFLISILLISSHATWTMEDFGNISFYKKIIEAQIPHDPSAQYDRALQLLNQSINKQQLLNKQNGELHQKIKEDDETIRLLCRVIHQQLSNTTDTEQVDSTKEIKPQRRKSF
ncbi:MAG: hypothetical protein JO129_00140 [Candidatus Dependentiae bacterium]|nr:hypothetical protein [Candidatus Dependentiae bacterium]